MISALRREKWEWLPVLFLKVTGRSELPGTVGAAPSIDANGQTLLRIVARMLPHCVPEGTREQRKLEEISDQLEVLSGGLPESEWAESLARELMVTKSGGEVVSTILVSWG